MRCTSRVPPWTCAALALLCSCDDHLYGYPIGYAPAEAVDRPDYSVNIQPIWTAQCVGCHAGPSPSGDLSLVEGSSYAALVEVPSEGDPGLVRVQPGSPEDSYLFQLLASGAMPVGGSLSDVDLENVKTWISQGALEGGGDDSDTD